MRHLLRLRLGLFAVLAVPLTVYAQAPGGAIDLIALDQNVKLVNNGPYGVSLNPYGSCSLQGIVDPEFETAS